MSVPLAIAISLGAAPAAAFSFAPAATARSRSVVLRSRATDQEEPFDPFLQSPLSYGASGGDDGGSTDPQNSGSSFGFLSSFESHESSSHASDKGNSDADVDFDPLLSPHAYVNGADAAPVATEATATFSVEMSSSSTFGFLAYESIGGDGTDEKSPAVDMDFDPLLSPHAYVNGIDAGPVTDDGQSSTATTKKLGILLIDHGSRRQASNEHIHSVAQMYETILNKKEGSGHGKGYETTIVRAAHMEIATPSIADSLRNIIAVDRVSKVVCVPYFLSPGRHATEDVPSLIEEARGVLAGEGFAATEVVVSNALGTHLEGMLGAVDHLVERCLDEIEGGS